MRELNAGSPERTLTLRGVKFGYRGRPLLFNDLDLTLADFPVAVLGPNGAGKSTLLRLISASLKMNMGVVSLNGVDSSTRRGRRVIAKSVGVLEQDVLAIPGLHVQEQVAYAGWLRGMSRTEAWKAAGAALALVDLAEVSSWRVSSLSGGQRRRLGIAQAAIHSPRLLLLDEPHAGLDPDQRGVLREAISVLNEHMAVVISTHQTDDLEGNYASVVVLDAGRILFFGSVEEFTAGQRRGIPSHLRAETAYREIVSGQPHGPA